MLYSKKIVVLFKIKNFTLKTTTTTTTTFPADSLPDPAHVVGGLRPHARTLKLSTAGAKAGDANHRPPSVNLQLQRPTRVSLKRPKKTLSLKKPIFFNPPFT